MNAFEEAAARREERREEKRRRDLLASASRFSSSVQISEEEIESIRRWEGAAAAADAVAASKERGQYTKISRQVPSAPGQTPSSAPVSVSTGRQNFLAKLSLASSIIPGGVVGIALGVAALSQIRRTGEAGTGVAIAGIVVGCVNLVLASVYLTADWILR